MPFSKPSVAVIIPFYQREPGLLATAVHSVFAQDLSAIREVTVIVVDDGSPSNWRAEGIADAPSGFRLVTIEKPNGGVSSARNAGLDAVTPDVDYIAFLDSDDSWFADHLDLAVAGLDGGADMYFSDCLDHDDHSFLAYASDPRITSVRVGELLTMSGFDWFDLLLCELSTHTSFTAFRRTAGHDLRFEKSLKIAGEDHLFFLQLTTRARSGVLRRVVTGRRDFGVSIYRSALSWDSPLKYERVSTQIRCLKIISEEFELSQPQQTTVQNNIQALCDELIFLSARDIFSQFRSSVPVFLKLLADAPSVLLRMPISLKRLLDGTTRRNLIGSQT